MRKILAEINKCRLCADQFNHPPRPIVRANANAKILIAGQAPGRLVHETGIPFNDPSGVRLRLWLGISEEEFYDINKIALVPMAFCYPGTGKQGDLPPPKICAQTWRAKLLGLMPRIEFSLFVGKHAIDWHFRPSNKLSLAQVTANWVNTLPESLAIPHPSPRNNRWLKNNPWFERECVPRLRDRVRQVLG